MNGERKAQIITGTEKGTDEMPLSSFYKRSMVVFRRECRSITAEVEEAKEILLARKNLKAGAL